MTPSILSEREVLAVLGEIDSNHNLWRAFMSILYRRRDNEIAIALGPNMTDSDRAYQNGRGAEAHDAWAYCQTLLEEAQKQARDEQSQQPS